MGSINAIIAQGPRPPEVISPQQSMAQMVNLRSAMQGQQLQQQQLQAAQMENQQRAIQLDQTRALNAAYQSALTVDPTTGQANIDRDSLTQALAKAGHGSAIPTIMKSLNDYDKSNVDLQQARTNLAKAEAEHAGSLGASVRAAGYDPQLFLTLTADAVRQKHVEPQIVAPMIQQVQQAMQQDPSGAAAKQVTQRFADQMISGSEKQRELDAAAQTARARQTTAQTGAEKEQREKDLQYLDQAAGAQSQDQLDQLRTGAKAAGISDAAIARIPNMYSPGAMQAFGRSLMTAEQRTQADQAAAVAAETAKRDAANEGAARTRNAIAGGELDLNRKKFDATIGAGLDANGQPLSPDAMKQAAQADPNAVAIANYQMPPANLRSPIGAATMRKVMALNPQYDGTQFQARNKTAQDYSPAGQSGKTFTSIDNALAHVNMLSEAGKALDNSDLPALNRIANELGYQFGGSAKNVYDGIVQVVGPEIIKGTLGEAGGEGERARLQQTLSSDANTQTREQTLGSIAQIFGKRVNTMRDAYRQQMGGKEWDRQLGQDSQAVLQRYSGGGAAKLPNGGGRSLDETTARQFLQAAGGDKAKARQLAQQNNWKL